MPAIRVNQQILSDLGVDLAMPTRFHVAPRSFPTVAVSGRAGGLLAGPARREAGTLAMTGRLVQTSAAAREAAEADLEDLLGGGVLLETDDGFGTLKSVLGVTTRLEFTPQPSWFTGINSEIRWDLLCPDPTWRSATPLHRALPPGVRVSIPVGTMPAPWRIFVYGTTGSTWSVVFRRANGLTIATLAASGSEATLDLDQVVELDGWQQTAIKTDTATPPAINFLPYLAGDFPPAGISPEDGWRALGLFPTVELVGAAGEFWGEQRWGR